MTIQIYSSRRKIIWSKLNDWKSITSFGIATALGAGLFPVAPGTMGTLVAIPLAYWTHSWPVLFQVLFWALLILVGSGSAKVFDEAMGTSDNQNIVIDEVIGLGITAWTAGTAYQSWIAAFVLFRFFDVLKPPPVGQIDQWSKNQSSPWLRGFGVIADDMMAGFQALAVILLLQFLHFLP